MCSNFFVLQKLEKEKKKQEELERKLETEKVKKEIENKRTEEISKFKLLLQPEPINDNDVCFIICLIIKCFNLF